ncbi:MAG: hypothetical protein JOZ69_21470, partial [Myxococcales bacterium]|nr:hypothetical protein [Myxococcales bacterium]
MAHDRVRATDAEAHAPPTATPSRAPPGQDDTSDLGAIDRLLAETDRGWDVEDQVLTLKQAALVPPPARTAHPPAAPALPAHAARPLALAGSGSGPGAGAPSARVPEPSDALSTVPISRSKRPPRMPASVPPPPVPPSVPPPSPPGTVPAPGIARARRKGPPPLPPTGQRAPGPELPAAGDARDRAPSSPSSAIPSGALPSRAPVDMSHPAALVELLVGRIAALGAACDTVGLARAHLELAVASEVILADDARAVSHAQAALRVNPGLPSAHAMLRRKRHARAMLPEMLGHLDEELAAAVNEAHRVELLAERARLLWAMGDRSAEVRATWEQALSYAPHHAGALKGLEAELVSRAHAGGPPADWEDWGLLAVHLGRMADAYRMDPRLGAWLHVERAHVLERKLGRTDAARGALERALELDASVGPVRAALVRHVATHADWASLVRLLDEEARFDESPVRAARLELDAAAIAAASLGDRPWACTLLERAAGRAPTLPAVDRRVLEDLMRLYELEARWSDEARVRRARIAFLTDPATIAYELQALAAVAERAGDLDGAIADVQRALSVDATYPTLVGTLDRLLRAAERPDQRVAVWLQEAARAEDPAVRARALTRAARVCEELGRRADAIRHLRSAWITAPGDGEVLDALARQLSPQAGEAGHGGARALADLYAQAAEHDREPARKVAYLERVALLWEEVLGDPERAARAYEEVLALDADRRSALLGLERTAARSGDARALARALLDEARLAVNPATELALRTRAAAALEGTDPTRALALAREVLAEDPKHAGARELEAAIEERAGRFHEAARSIRARIDAVAPGPERLALWLTLARLQRGPLHAPLDALASLEQASLLDPTHPVPPDEIVRALEAHSDASVLRDAVLRLAARAVTPEDRTRHLARAAEIDELRLGDDAGAIRTLQRALTESPDDDLVAERLSRAVARHARRSGGGELGELATLLSKRIEHAGAAETARAMSFDLAALLVELDREPLRSTALLETTLAHQGDHAPALRTLESLHRRTGDLAPLARVLDKQGALL